MTVTKYCDVHGGVIVPVETQACPTCQTMLKGTPEELVGRAVVTQGSTETAQNSTPIAQARERADKTLHQGAFLAAYARRGDISKAADEAGVNRRRHYEWLKDPDYEAAFKAAHQDCIDDLVGHVVNRARGLDGSPASDRLAIKLLESIPSDRMPVGWKFNNPTKHEHSGPGGKPIEHNVSPAEQLLSRISSLTPGAGETPTP